jgi:oxygen-independent coproporphyrinogen-3 oxidase
LTPEWIAVLGAIGVDRVSLGVQTFAPHVQQAIGRIQPTEMIITAVDSLRAAGVGSVNFDLMYGLPGQSLEDLADTLTTALDIRPDRISLFGYAHLPAMLPRQRRIDSASLPDGRLRFDQAALGYQRLTDTGYRPVGFDHFARPDDPLALAARQGRLRRNFQGFTDDEGDTLIGLGASAISQFPDLLAQNEKMAGRYRMIVNAEQLSARRGVVRTAEDRRRGTAIERFLCDGQAMLDDDLFAQAGAGLAKFVERGLVTLQKGMICLGDGGLPYARAIASRLDAYRMESSGRFSHAV